jgi:hypothetical protein
MTNLKDVVFETDHHWVKRVPKGFEVYKTGLTHSTRVAIIGYTGDKGLQRAKAEIERREAASGPSARHHATKKKSSAQLDREIEAFLQGRVHAPNMPHAIPDRGYMVAQHGGGTYLSSFGSKEEAVRFARGLAKQTREAYDIVKVQNRGEDRFIVDEIEPPGRRSHSTKKRSDEVSVGDEIYAVSGGRRHGPGIVEEIYDDGTMRVDFTRQFAGRLRVRPQDLIFVPEAR